VPGSDQRAGDGPSTGRAERCMVTWRIQGARNVEVGSCARTFIEVHALGGGLRAIGGRHQSSCLAAAFPSDGEGAAPPGGNRSRRAGYDQKMSAAVSFSKLRLAFQVYLRTALRDKMGHRRDRYPKISRHPSNYTLHTLCKELRDCEFGLPRRASKPRRISRT
jgi:hypothetical protein